MFAGSRCLGGIEAIEMRVVNLDLSAKALGLYRSVKSVEALGLYLVVRSLQWYGL